MATSRIEMSSYQERNGRARQRRKSEFLAGASLLGAGLWKRGALGKALLASGAFLIYRAAARNLPSSSVFEVSQTVNLQPAEVYAYWRDLNHWPLFMEQLMSNGQQPKVTPDAIHIVENRANEMFRWRSELPERTYEGVAEFREAPGNRGTEIRLNLLCICPRSLFTHLAKLSSGSGLEQQARESLRTLKQLLEAGEIPTTDGQPHGSRGLKGKGIRKMFREGIDEKRRPARVAQVRDQELAAS
jgi:uncharacterized membrane protein